MKGNPEINRMGVPLAVEFATWAKTAGSWSWFIPPQNVRPALHAVARGAGRAGCGAAPGVSGEHARS